MIKNVYYWCPFIGNIATIKAVVNSAYSLVKYSDGRLIPTIINSYGEWDDFSMELKKKKIYLKNLKFFFSINRHTSGYLKSRIAYIKIFFSSFIFLKDLLKKDKPEYLIAHLITSLPIFLFLVFNFKTKLVIRISGKVRMNIFRKMLWKLSKKNIFLITCPTKETQKEFTKYNLVEASKIIYLPDPVIQIKEIINEKREKIKDKILSKPFFVMIGRYTRQKNHLLAIKCIKNIIEKNYNIGLIIIGNGELKNDYLNEINNLQLSSKIKLIDYQKNIANYLNQSLGLISSSLWEDPGFVMIEAAACNTFIISSDCSNGPKEFIGNENGILFRNNDIKSLEENILKFLNMSSYEIMKKKVGAKKQSLNFTKLRHFKILSKNLI